MANPMKPPSLPAKLPELLTRQACFEVAGERYRRHFDNYRSRPALEKPHLGPLDTDAYYPDIPVPTVKDRKYVPSFFDADVEIRRAASLQGLGGILDQFEAAWDSAKAAVFGDDDRDKAMADLNRVVSVLVGLKGTMNDMSSVPYELQSAYNDLFSRVRVIISSICARDSDFRVLLPSDLGMSKYAKCVQEVSRTAWHNRVKKQSYSTGSSVSGLGILPAVPVLIVVAVVVISASAVAVSYLLTDSGRKQMSAAKTSADAASAIARGVLEGTITAKEAKELIQELPSMPTTSSTLKTLGTVAVVGAVGLGAFWIFLRARAQ